MTRLVTGTSASVVLMCAGGAIASPIVIQDFDSLVHGEIVYDAAQPLVGGQFEPFITITGSNPNRSHDIVAAYDTLVDPPGADPDLEGPPWSGGNLAPNAILGRVLIIAENDNGSGDGILDSPDDEGRRPSGYINFQFSAPIDCFGFDVIDIEGMVEDSMLEFYSGGGFVGSVNLGEFTDNLSTYYDPTVTFGNNYANRIAPITAASLGVASFDEVRIQVGGSSGWDRIVVPAPGSIALLGLAGIAGTRRRR